MLHPEAEDRCRVVVADLLFLGVETCSLGDVPFAVAEDVEGHLEADRLLVAMDSGRFLAVDLVAGSLALEVRRDIASVTRWLVM